MALRSAHNYYEHLVYNRLDQLARETPDRDFLEDVACVALNYLPTRYVRRDVDLLFHMSAAEREQMHNNVDKAVRLAVEYVRKHRSRPMAASD